MLFARPSSQSGSIHCLPVSSALPDTSFAASRVGTVSTAECFKLVAPCFPRPVELLLHLFRRLVVLDEFHVSHLKLKLSSVTLTALWPVAQRPFGLSVGSLSFRSRRRRHVRTVGVALSDLRTLLGAELADAVSPTYQLRE